MAYIREIIDRYPWLAMVRRRGARARPGPCSEASASRPARAHARVHAPPGRDADTTRLHRARALACALRAAQDTEFPGCVARPIGTFRTRTESNYQNIRCNVDLLNLIQLGITFSDADGLLPPGCSTWQFNFKFSLKDDLYAQDSIELLTQAGIDFGRHDEFGISPLYFAELLMVSGVVLNEDVRWISFHSGYDFGYLLKLLTCKPLPLSEPEFFELLRTYFPAIYDIKFIASNCDNLKGGLNKLAELLEVRGRRRAPRRALPTREAAASRRALALTSRPFPPPPPAAQVPRIGPEHQAGSDSLLTQATFFKLRQAYFDDFLDDETYLNVLWGLGTGVSFNSGGNGAGFQFSGGSPHPGLSGHGLGSGHSGGGLIAGQGSMMRLPQPDLESVAM